MIKDAQIIAIKLAQSLSFICFISISMAAVRI